MNSVDFYALSLVLCFTIINLNIQACFTIISQNKKNMKTKPIIISFDRYTLDKNLIATPKKNQDALLSTQNRQTNRQNPIEIQRNNKIESINFDDHQYFQRQNQSLMQSKLTESINQTKIVIKKHKSFGQKKKEKAEDQGEERQGKFVNYHFRDIIRKFYPQNQQINGQNQSKQSAKNHLQSNNLYKKKANFQNNQALFLSNTVSHRNSVELSAKKQNFAEKMREIIFINFAKKKNRQKSAEKVSFFSSKEDKRTNFSDIFTSSKKQDMNTRRKFSQNAKIKKQSLSAVYKMLKPTEIKALNLSNGQKAIEQNLQNMRQKDLRRISQELLIKMRRRKYMLEKGLLLRKQREQRGKVQKDLRININAIHLNGRSFRCDQKDEVKGWEIQAFNSLPQFL